MTSRWSTSGSPACSPTPGTIGAYRGAGRPECLLNLERLVDTAARQIGIDPAELRRRNFVTPAQMPYTSAMGEKYDTGDFNLFLTKTLAAADWNGFAARKAEAEKRGKLYGRGLASYVEWTGAMVMNEMAHYEVKADGKVVIWMGTQGMGQGLRDQLHPARVGASGHRLRPRSRSPWAIPIAWAASARWARARPISAARPC